ncbi:copper homeostasis protein CutC, partial [Proteus mirabilis]|nr:copper homeostasis protein CutC [Proteus mirabilis]
CTHYCVDEEVVGAMKDIMSNYTTSVS